MGTTAERESAKKIKEDLCYVSNDFAGKEKQFEMPDGTIVTVHNQMIRCPELMFKPSLDGKEMMGLHELTKKTVNDCDLDVRKDLLGNVVMSGGTTMFPNMPERLQAELQGLVPGHQGQGHCSSRAHDLCLDWRIHPGVSVHLQPHVDQQGVQPRCPAPDCRIRGGRPTHCPPDVQLLSARPPPALIIRHAPKK